MRKENNLYFYLYVYCMPNKIPEELVKINQGVVTVIQETLVCHFETHLCTLHKCRIMKFVYKVLPFVFPFPLLEIGLATYIL